MNQQHCNDWYSNPEINPLTQRKIKKNGPVYKKLEKMCNIQIIPDLEVYFKGDKVLDISVFDKNSNDKILYKGTQIIISEQFTPNRLHWRKKANIEMTYSLEQYKNKLNLKNFLKILQDFVQTIYPITHKGTYEDDEYSLSPNIELINNKFVITDWDS